MGCRSYLPDGSAHDAVVRFIKKIIVVEMPMGKNKTRKRESYFFRFFRFFGSKFGNFLGIWEHTKVSARQRAGTLGRVVKYDQEAFTKAWDYLQ